MSKEEYRIFAEQNNLPLYHKPWWLDAVCNKNWDAIVLKHGEAVSAVFPFYTPQKNYINMPMFTMSLGPLIYYPDDMKNNKKHVYEKNLISKLLKALGDFKYFHSNFNPEITNWQPFYWHNFSCTVRYTHYIYLTKDKNYLDLCTKKKKALLKKAKENFTVKFNTLNCKEFYREHCLKLKLQNKTINYQFKDLERIWNAGKVEKSLKVVATYNQNGSILGASLMAYDSKKAYSLIGFHEPGKKAKGSKDLTKLAMMEEATRMGLEIFDFEGSMIKSVAENIYSFGATQIPYFQITKDNRNLLFKLKDYLIRKLF